jgi:hypothetical protein
MSHFARIDENNVVQEVLVIEQDQIDTGLWGDSKLWIQTSYNTLGGVHYNGGTPFRKNFAGPGYIYDAERDAFYEPKPSTGTWVLNEDTCYWERPIPYPSDATDAIMYMWSEDQQNWIRTDDPLQMGK